MDASELLTVAMDAMPLMVLEAADQGQVYGVLSMALRTLEAQHAALLAEADEENRQAMTVIAEMTQQETKLQAELLRLHNEVKTVTAERDDLRNELSRALADRNLFRRERDQVRSQIDEMAERRGPLHSHSEFVALEKERNTWKNNYQVVRDEIDKVITQRDTAWNNLAEVTAERDGWKSEAGELQRRIDNLNAENARLHRSMEQWMSAAQHAQAVPPGAVKVVPPGVVKVVPVQAETKVTTLAGEVTHPANPGVKVAGTREYMVPPGTDEL